MGRYQHILGEEVMSYHARSSPAPGGRLPAYPVAVPRAAPSEPSFGAPLVERESFPGVGVSPEQRPGSSFPSMAGAPPPCSGSKGSINPGLFGEGRSQRLAGSGASSGAASDLWKGSSGPVQGQEAGLRVD